MRYTGHLDLRRAWERTMRRAGLPLAYSQGFNPRPVLSLASPLPLGFTSTHEIGDFWMSEVCDLVEATLALKQAAPPGIGVHHLEEIADIHGEKLPNLIQSSQYIVALPPEGRKTGSADPCGANCAESANLERQVAQLLEQEHLQRKRKKKEYDLRPLIEKLEVIAPNAEGDSRLHMQLSTRSGATGRPDEVLLALGLDPLQADICRTRILLKSET